MFELHLSSSAMNRRSRWRRSCATIARTWAPKLLVLAILAPVGAGAEPFVPTEDSQILERLPTPGTAAQLALRRLRADVDADPDNLDLALRLARRYIQVSRAESDPRYRGYAEAALAPWIGRDEPPIEVLVLRATLRQSLHDFDGALADLSQVLAADPNNFQAWLTRAIVLQVQGNFSQAIDSCMRLRRSGNRLVTATCESGAASRNGRAEASYERLRDLIGQSPNADPGVRLWVLTMQGEIANALGKTEAAERHFREALSLGLRDGYLFGAYADFLLDQGRPEEVRDLLEGEIRADALFLRFVLAQQRLGASDTVDHVAALRARFAANRMRGDRTHLREEARFALHVLNDDEKALRLAKANWQIQREPWDARLVLEAALAAAAPAEAAAVVEWLKGVQLEDQRIQSLVEKLGRFAG